LIENKLYRLLNSKIFIAFGALLGIFFTLTIVFAVLYGVEKNKTSAVKSNKYVVFVLEFIN
jgi:hypothetical protein